MEEADKYWMMIRMVGGWVFLLVPAHPGSPGQRAVKRLLCCCCCFCILSPTIMFLLQFCMSPLCCIFIFPLLHFTWVVGYRSKHIHIIERHLQRCLN